MTTRYAERSRLHWSQIGERGIYIGMWLMFHIYRLVGRLGFALFLYPVVFYFFIFGRAARDASHSFLERVHNCSADRKFGKRGPRWYHSFRHFITFGDTLLDKLAAWSGRICFNEVVYENIHVIEPLVRARRGGLLITSHLGNSEVGRAIGSLAPGIRLLVLVHTRHSGNFNRLMQEANPDTKISLIQTTEIGPDTAIRLQESISRGEFVVIAGDRTPVMQSQRVSWVPFLGRKAPFPQGPYILANLLRCPVRLLFCVKEKSSYHIVFEDFSDNLVVPRRTREATLDHYAGLFAERLAHHAARHPYQWFNFFDFWTQAATMESGSGSSTAQESVTETTIS